MLLQGSGGCGKTFELMSLVEQSLTLSDDAAFFYINFQKMGKLPSDGVFSLDRMDDVLKKSSAAIDSGRTTIALIDECTQLREQDIAKLAKMCRVIMVGDTRQ